MSERAIQTTLIEAPADACWEVATDFERYPEWAGDIKHVTVTERDEGGRAVVVRFRSAAFGRSTSYTLRYNYEESPRVLSWVEVDGDLTTKLDGSYEFSELVRTGGLGTPLAATEVVYRLEAELKVPILPFLKRRVEGRIMHTALRELKARVEARPAP